MKRSDYVRMERRMLDRMDESDAAHGSKHVYRVLYLALDIAAHEPEADADVVIAACLLHDIARAEQAKDPSVDHARAGAEKARSLLLEEGFDAEFAQAVSDCVRTHRFRSDDPPVSLEAKILFDADKLDVSGAVGSEGFLYVIKDMGMKEPYIGQVPIISGEVAEDITNYYATSEQVPTVCGLGVLVNPDLTVSAAGGYLLQLLPGADEETISHVEENIKKLAPVSSMIRQGITPQQIAFQALDGFEPNIIDEYEMGYVCDCTRARVERALISLGKQELEQIRQEGKPIEVGCQFCDKKYVFTPNDVKGLIARL